LVIGSQDTVENVGDVFFGTQCSCKMQAHSQHRKNWSFNR